MTEAPSLDSFFGRNMSYSKENLDIYNSLMTDRLSPFREKTMSEVYIYAAVSGFIRNARVKLTKSVPNISVVAMSRRHRAVLISLALQEAGDIDILFRPAEVRTMIDEFANGGITRLSSELIGDIHEADAITKMSSAMRENISKWIMEKDSR